MNLEDLRELLENPKPVLFQAGAIMAAGSERAFTEQRFGSIPWPERYPNQTEPFINVAGALADFEKGRAAPLPRRFVRRPALKDREMLAQSITFALSGPDGVEVGSSLPYANVHQHGGVSTQRVSETAKQAMRKWLQTPQGSAFRGKLIPLTQPNVTQHDTEVVQRPFVGISDEIESELIDMIEKEFNA